MPSSEKLLKNPEALCNMVRRVALEAGEIILEFFETKGPLDIEEKGDGSPVSLADRESEAFIVGSLKSITPDIPIIGEESTHQGYIPDIDFQGSFWLVDPLDGTKEFLNDSPDFTVNIALINEGNPILGVVFAPAAGILYAGFGPATALRWGEDSEKDKPIRVRIPPKEGLTAIASSQHGDTEKLDRFLEQYKIAKLLKKGSSLKICAIAEGKADLYPRFGPTHEWDTAAADAVLRSAGGQLTDTSGAPLRYGDKQRKFLNPEFIASSFDWKGEDIQQ